jgi:GntR family transcriptional regulator, transcriptional repressor for pyruvate dehydrogenase complex
VYKTMKQKKLSEEVVSHFTELIMQQQLRPGDRLPPERQLAEELGVSRTSLREAVKRLQEKGLLDARQGSGTFVRSLSADALSESLSLFVQSDINRYLGLMELRSILDVEIAGRLAVSATEDDIAHLMQHIELMSHLLDSPDKFADEDVAFHLAFYESMNNSLLMSIVQPIMTLLNEAMQVTFVAPGAAASSLRRHIALIECIRAHDAEGARGVMRAIIARGEERVSEHLRATHSAMIAGVKV